MSAQLEPPEPPEIHSDAIATSEIESLELLRRSPHPYHRRQTDLRQSQRSSESSSNDLLRTTLTPSQFSKDEKDEDEDGRKRRKLSRSPSDSGTEADDEGYGFVKALPAPPIKPRKGLRDARGLGYNGGVSPLLTPSLVDEEGRKYSREYFKVQKEANRTGEPSPTDEETRGARQKYLKRRRAELVRRITETALLGAIGFWVIRGCGHWRELLGWHRAELITHILVFCIVLGLYPLRLFLYSWTRGTPSNRRLRQRIRIPAAFDPAPILYPVTIPVFIAISLFPAFEKILLPNIILGLAALPAQLVPYGAQKHGFSMVHWFLSALPLITSQSTEWPSKIFPSTPYMLKSPPPQALDPEMLVTLFALHQALLPPLHYLTTTSLLPTELHLLSIGLINLLLFSNSPQMIILQTLLWFGGVCLFVTCGKVLKWGVALARIPRWRFRRAGQIIKARQSFLQTLNEVLKPKRSLSTGAGRAEDSSADEDEERWKTPRKRTGSLRLNILDSMRHASLYVNGDAEVKSAVEHTRPIGFPLQDEKQISPRARRNTLATLPEPSRQTSSSRRRSKSTIASSFLSLTPTQAATRKWIYAGYFYLVAAATILLPIRYIIGRYALQGDEPFGWAIGYLLGQIQPLRFKVFAWDLENWIALPSLQDPTINTNTATLGLAEHIRHTYLGAANTRLLLCIYCLCIIALGLLTVFRLSSIVEVDTRRKVFHGMMVLMLLPTIYIDPAFVALALTIILALFLLLDLIRASQLPPLSRPLAQFLTPYVDGRDLRGPVVVSHIFLLIGCAIPLWLGLAGLDRSGEEPWVGWEVEGRDVSMVAGVVCVGMGDAAASLIGRRYGRRKWPWAGGKSLEGSLAFAVAVTVGLVGGKVWLEVGQWDRVSSSSQSEDNGGFALNLGCLEHWIMVLGKAMMCAAGASLNEAVLTGGNDNVIVPVVLWLLVRGLKL